MGTDRALQCREIAIEDIDHIKGGILLGDGREIAHIGKQHGQRLDAP